MKKAGGRARGAVAASDAFFPFADGVEALAEAGITAVIQPGGSKRDEEVVEAANQSRASRWCSRAGGTSCIESMEPPIERYSAVGELGETRWISQSPPVSYGRSGSG